MGTPKTTQFSHLLTFYTNNAPDKKISRKLSYVPFSCNNQQTLLTSGSNHPHTISPPTHSYPTSEVRFYFFTRLITLHNSAFRFVHCLRNVFTTNPHLLDLPSSVLLPHSLV